MSESLDETKRELFELMQRMRREHFTSSPPEGLTQAEARTMMAIDAMRRCCEETRPGRVAEITHTTPSALSQTFKALEERGLIMRRRADGDYRAVTVSLTEQGERLAREGRRMHERHMDEILVYLGESDARHLVRILRKIVEFHECKVADPLTPADTSPEGGDASCV